MAILKIARMGNPVLVRRCEPVPDPSAPEIRRLVADMIETMEDAPGVGLAAPQVHVPLRLFVFRIPAERGSAEPEDVAVGTSVLINPELELLSEDRVLRWEACLSIPGLRGAVPRARRVRYRGVDCEGSAVERIVSGFHAGVIQHEYRPSGRDPLHHAPERLPAVRLHRGSGARGAGRRQGEILMHPPERSPERDAAIDALLPNVPFDGWTFRALRQGLVAIGQDPEDAALLFPAGAPDMIEAYCDLADRRMEEAAAALDMTLLRVPARVRALIALRFRQNRLHKEAARRALGVLALPGNARVAAACTARTVDAIWHASGDRSADFSWYTKRATLAGVYSATLLFWVRDTSEEDVDTLAFLDRRLAGVGRIGRVRRRIEGVAARLRPPALRGA